MGTTASVVCSNPNKLSTKSIDDVIILYMQTIYNSYTRKINCSDKGEDIEIDALFPTTEEEFQAILGMLDTDYDIKIVKTNWWEFKK